jgi:MscS family membrane protein
MEIREKINYLQKYEKYDILSSYMKYSTIITSRRNSFFSIITWILMSISTTVLYSYMSSAPGWGPASLATIDTIYSIMRILIFVVIIVHIVSFLFREIEHSFLVDGIVIRRFLPLIKVIILGLIWIGGIFSVLDSLHINTTSILTGTGIAGVLLAIASRDIITNLFGSLSILLSRTFDIGEIIRIQLKSNSAYE